MTAEEARALMPKKEPTVQDIIEEINIEIANAAREGKPDIIIEIEYDKVDEVVKHFNNNGFTAAPGNVCIGECKRIIISWAE